MIGIWARGMCKQHHSIPRPEHPDWNDLQCARCVYMFFVFCSSLFRLVPRCDRVHYDGEEREKERAQRRSIDVWTRLQTRGRPIQCKTLMANICIIIFIPWRLCTIRTPWNEWMHARAFHSRGWPVRSASGASRTHRDRWCSALQQSYSPFRMRPYWIHYLHLFIAIKYK